MAMCFSLAALGGVPVRINDPDCVRKTFPDYFAVLRRLARMSAASPPVIAVDGPAASGKGTVAQGVAQGAGLPLSRQRFALPPGGAEGAADGHCPRPRKRALAAAAAALASAFVGDRILLDGVDVTDAIRAQAVSAAASRVAVHPGGAPALLARQRAFRRPPGLVADGRDMGTVVFPDARLKVYVTASAEERARRRYKQLIEKGNSGYTCKSFA